MIFIFNRMGWLIPVISFTGLVVSQIVIDTIFSEGTYSNNKGIQYLSFVTGSIFIYLLGSWLNSEDKLIIRQENSRELLEILPPHTFFFIEFQWWGIIIPLLTIGFII